MSRKTKCTPDLIREVTKLLRRGHFRAQAAEGVGIAPETFARWMARGDDPESPKRYGQFRQAVLKAEAFGRDKALARLDALVDSEDEAMQFKSLTWLLERRHGFRREAHVKVEAKVNHTFNDDDLIDELQDLIPMGDEGEE
jgi:hypothetical protein